MQREVREVVVRSIWVEGGWRRRNDGGHGGDGRARKQQQHAREKEREGQSE